MADWCITKLVCSPQHDISIIGLILHALSFSDIFFIDSTTAQTIDTDLKSIALAKRCGESAQAALAWLVSHNNDWLLLFNNADDTSLVLREYFPLCLHGNIIITSRNHKLCTQIPDTHQFCTHHPDTCSEDSNDVSGTFQDILQDCSQSLQYMHQLGQEPVQGSQVPINPLDSGS